MRTIGSLVTLAAALLVAGSAEAQVQEPPLLQEARSRTDALHAELVAWRRDIHQHPELGDQEERTSRIVADHLRRLGLEVRTGVARTGVVGILEGGRPGPTVALRADMDALPVKEETGLPFASTATGTMFGKEVPLMHACGHDAHTAMLMAVAQALAGMREELPGRVVFIFQPAEEGSSVYPPGSGEKFGAELMLEEGLFEELRPDAIFAVHVMVGPSGELSWRTGPITATSDTLEIAVFGRQGHGGMPWSTIDAVTTSAQIITGLQTVVSRRVDLTQSPAVVTVGTIHGGARSNIVAGSVHMTGTIRTYGEAVRKQVHEEVERVATKIAESAGARADVTITRGYPTTINDESLTQRMAPVLTEAADGKVARAPLAGASEDFGFFSDQVPGLYVFLGVTPPDVKIEEAAPNHNPGFLVDESALVVGARALSMLAVAFLTEPRPEEDRPRGERYIEDQH